MIWLVGNKGMLGSDIEKCLLENSLPYIASDREVDITDPTAMEKYLTINITGTAKLSWIINCSAYTAVDMAEDQEELVFKINAIGVKNLAEIAKKRGAVVIHISTDYVYNGRKEDMYLEEDPADPLSVYGKSKLAGEEALRDVLKEHYIIRSAWLYGKNNKNFVYTMLKLFNKMETVKVVADQWGSPTYSLDLARAITVILKAAKQEYGTYHFTNEERTNWFEFAREIFRLGKAYISKDVNILPIKTEEYPTKAMRPANSYLSKEKIKKTFGISIRPWIEALEDFLSNDMDEKWIS